MMFRMYNPGSKHTTRDMLAHLCTPSKKISYASKFRDLLQSRTNESNLHTSSARIKREENAKHKVRHYNVQDKKDVKHNDVKMNWLCKLFPKFNLAEGKTNIRGSSTVMSHYHFRTDPDLDKGNALCSTYHVHDMPAQTSLVQHGI
eukprot:14471499-Ditylum_brightwellii.AAC.1